MTPAETRAYIAASAAKHGVNPNFALATALSESQFNPSAVGRQLSGDQGRARGMWQVVDKYAKSWGFNGSNDARLYDAKTSTDTIMPYLKKLQNQYKGDIALMRTAFQSGPGYANKIAKGADPAKVLGPEGLRDYVRMATVAKTGNPDAPPPGGGSWKSYLDKSKAAGLLGSVRSASSADTLQSMFGATPDAAAEPANTPFAEVPQPVAAHMMEDPTVADVAVPELSWQDGLMAKSIATDADRSRNAVLSGIFGDTQYDVTLPPEVEQSIANALENT